MSYTLNRLSILNFVILIIATLVPIIMTAQEVPQAFPYQGVARDGDQVVTGQVGLQFFIRQGSINGPSVYQEEVMTITNPEGVFSLNIGEMDSITFGSIDWAQGPYFLQVRMDPKGGNTFSDLGTTPILSVPYALYARSAGTAKDDLDKDPINEIQALNKSGNTISLSKSGGSIELMDDDPENEIQQLSLTGQKLSLQPNGGEVILPSTPLYSAGNGIGIQNNVITNTAPHVNSTLSLNGQALSILPGGSSVTLPSGGGSNWSSSGSNIFRTNGNVGIGTSNSLSRRLTVNNSMSIRNTNGAEGIYLTSDDSDGEGIMALYGPNSSANVILRGSGTGFNHGFLGLYNHQGDLKVEARSEGSQNVGQVRTYGQSGALMTSMTFLNNYPDNGYIGIIDKWGDWRAAILLNSSGYGTLFTSPGNKNFRMEHPELPEKDIWYCSMEGPEAGVYDRGVACLKDGEAFISYSDHFLLVMNPETVTVTLTPKEWDTYGLAVTETTDRGFRVRELKNGKGNFSFFWEVKGKIRGHESYRVIRDRSESMPANHKILMDNEKDKTR